MPRLRFRVDPAADESLPGFLMRLAGRGRFRSASELAALAGLRQPGAAVSDAPLLALAELAGVAPDRLERMAYRPAGARGHHRFLGGTAHREFIWLAQRRACPVCLREAPHHRSEWDFAPATACVRHRCRLLWSCPACGGDPGWDGPAVAACSCGVRLDAVPSPSASDQEIASLAELHAVIRGAPLPWLHRDFAECGRSDLVRIVLALGAAAVGWEGHRRVASVVRAGPDRMAAVVTTGVWALRGWPESLAEMVGRGCRPPEDRPRRQVALSFLHKVVRGARPLRFPHAA